MKILHLDYRFAVIIAAIIFMISCKNGSGTPAPEVPIAGDTLKTQVPVEAPLVMDTVDYLKRISTLAHDSISDKWPAKTAIPNPGAILPFKRIVAYYGNFYSKNMGILGQYPEDTLIEKLLAEVAYWNNADPLTPVLPAIHYIAITAQSKPGAGNTFRLRMPEKQILRAIELGEKVKGITFLDVQVGHSTIKAEVPTLEKYLLNENVHLGIDPEWSMKDGAIPGRKIGSLDASDINFAIEFLTDLVRTNKLKPKILVVHRFTRGMITNSDKIKPTPEVQVVIDMDGFGFPAKKVDSYRRFVSGYPVQFTGFKLFYKNDILTSPNRMMTSEEVLNLFPKPIYIQYQ
ncbi:MAG: hypothetical protein IPL55_11350 [Saprospiraceae bacterium]|jgi:hypothetical protein|nr:hypothetical protein [Saprospiraceae bacterium]